MRKPVNMQSSLGELEYCFFLRHIYKNGEFQDAWSPAGQKYFKESVPDSYSLLFKKAYFFNGCLIHGHCKEKCRFQRSTSATHNFFGVPFDVARQQFESKITNLEKNHVEEIKSIEIQWECDWLYKKKCDKQVQEFLKKVFVNAPNFRLHPNAAGKEQL